MIDTLSSTYTFEGVGYQVLTGACGDVNTTVQQAAPNGCYFANNDTGVNIALPCLALPCLALQRGARRGRQGERVGRWVLMGAVNGGQIYTSSNASLTWIARESSRAWRSVASSTDGNKLVAVEDAGRIYTSRSSTTPGTTGRLQGLAGSSVELRYLGDGVFEVISATGSVTAH